MRSQRSRKRSSGSSKLVAQAAHALRRHGQLCWRWCAQPQRAPAQVEEHVLDAHDEVDPGIQFAAQGPGPRQAPAHLLRSRAIRPATGSLARRNAGRRPGGPAARCALDAIDQPGEGGGVLLDASQAAMAIAERAMEAGVGDLHADPLHLLVRPPQHFLQGDGRGHDRALEAAAVDDDAPGEDDLLVPGQQGVGADAVEVGADRVGRRFALGALVRVDGGLRAGTIGGGILALVVVASRWGFIRRWALRPAGIAERAEAGHACHRLDSPSRRSGACSAPSRSRSGCWPSAGSDMAPPSAAAGPCSTALSLLPHCAGTRLGAAGCGDGGELPLGPPAAGAGRPRAPGRGGGGTIGSAADRGRRAHANEDEPACRRCRDKVATLDNSRPQRLAEGGRPGDRAAPDRPSRGAAGRRDQRGRARARGVAPVPAGARRGVSSAARHARRNR